MLRSIKDLYGYAVRASDGEVGEVADFNFDDRTWTIRYLVVDVGEWIAGRRVLLSTIALGQPDWEEQAFPVLLTRWQVEHSPDIDTAQPVSRQMEEELYDYYGWAPYWWHNLPMASGPADVAALAAVEEHAGDTEPDVPEGELHLRSVKEIVDYYVQALDGEVGSVDDFVVDDEDWSLRYLVVDTGGWLAGRKVLVAPAWVREMEWAGNRIYVDLDQESIENSPEFDPSMPVNREYEMRLYDYYGRPRYWSRV